MEGIKIISFRTIRYKNFLSFGATFTEIKLDRSPTTLIVGENGAGKSTLLDALTFVLYGKPFRKINKPQLVNSVNDKNCLVEIEFEIGQRHYLVRRGIKPTVFEIYEDGTMIDQESKGRDYQGFLEKHILQMNYTAFTQVVVLGKATYTPFMQLKSNERRQLIEELLGLTIFSRMNDVLKRAASTLRDDLRNIEGSISVAEEKIDIHNQYIKQLREDKSDKMRKLADEIEEYKKMIDFCDSSLASINKNREKLIEETSDPKKYQEQIKQLYSYVTEFENKIKKAKKDIKLFADNDSCPTCAQVITDEFREQEITKLQSKIDKLDDTKQQASTQLEEVNETVKAIEESQSRIRNYSAEIEKLEYSRKETEKHIKKLVDQRDALANQQTDVDAEFNKVHSLVSDLDFLRKRKTEINEKASYLANIAVMLKDNGIKSIIVQKYLPIFNNLINQFLTQMGFFVKFNLDETFNETILSRHRDSFSYSSFSEGEKLRIDLAILLTWREIAKLKNALNTNLLLMDEIFDSSLDQTGVDSFIELIPAMENVNIFVVSHTPDKLTDKFRSQIRFYKDRNFSKIA